MPELPEVETIVRGLQDHLLHREIKRVVLSGHPVFKESPADFCERLSSTRINRIDRYGKAIFISLLKKGTSEPLTLRIHLGMTGQLLWVPINSPIASHTHVVFHLDHPTHHLRYRDIRRFGRLSLGPPPDPAGEIPDAWLASDAQIEQSLSKINGMLKHALLSQKILAGLGNIYVDEALHRAHLHPRKTGHRLRSGQRTLLARSIRAVLKRSIGLGGTSF